MMCNKAKDIFPGISRQAAWPETAAPNEITPQHGVNLSFDERVESR